jgi:Short-chain dehydrogenases of various substrate specificities
MCDSIRLELRHLGIGVGSAHPTFFPTPLMDDVVADPAGQALWGGNDRGFWKMIPREQVVRDIVAGIERRADMIVVPKTNTIVAKAPGFFRRFVERAGFRSSDVERAISLASATGWNESVTQSRAK